MLSAKPYLHSIIVENTGYTLHRLVKIKQITVDVYHFHA